MGRINKCPPKNRGRNTKNQHEVGRLVLNDGSVSFAAICSDFIIFSDKITEQIISSLTTAKSIISSEM